MRWLLTGGAVPVLLLLSGAFFLIYLRGYPFRAPRRMLSALSGEGGRGSFRALTEALAGTLGVGNIVGVAGALQTGGAGAIFWMWSSALVAMVLKYAESLLAVAHRREGRDGRFFGGTVYYMKDHFLSLRRPRTGRVICTAFAALTALASLTLGGAIQADAVGVCFSEVTGGSSAAVGGLLVLCTLIPLARGRGGIAALTEYLVPIMSGGYVLLSVAVLLLRADAVGDAFAAIFREAFAFESAAGGILGFLTSRALRVGTMRGLLSNEAGCGTSPTAHARAEIHAPAAQGVWGIFEVFADTVVLCTLTALVLLVAPAAPTVGASAMAMHAFCSVLGEGAAWFFCAALLCFGYATLLCWGSYGMEAMRFLSGRASLRYGYLSVFAVCVLGGACGTGAAVWDLADFAIAAMTAIHLCVLVRMRREVREQTYRFCKGKNGQRARKR